ncbi:MAG: hypothetical protein A2487_02455 [Candidatus Raymondbacteria bacterium RifOxyC12_full_50_8]|nr:MAG: hypothetical protein A2487_02455 [Candidatus Raymondbacteria bacterium RifOxyC12_full_50_8]
MIDLLILTFTDPNTASRRFRVEAFLPLLAEKGMSYVVRGLSDGMVPRLATLASLPRCKTALLQKKLLRPFELALLKKKCSRLIYDFDDAVYLGNEKNRKRFETAVRAADTVFAGNKTLADAAAVLHGDVVVVPTGLDVHRYRPQEKERAPTRIGWIGTRYNTRELHSVMEALAGPARELSLGLVYVSDRNDPALDTAGWAYEPWSETTEIARLASFDIGLMPLQDTPYARGKCGFKILQYMAMGVVPIASPIGVNKSIITHGFNGYLAKGPEEWTRALRALVTNQKLYRDMALKARERALDFSLERVFPLFAARLFP